MGITLGTNKSKLKGKVKPGAEDPLSGGINFGPGSITFDSGGDVAIKGKIPTPTGLTVIGGIEVNILTGEIVSVTGGVGIGIVDFETKIEGCNVILSATVNVPGISDRNVKAVSPLNIGYEQVFTIPGCEKEQEDKEGDDDTTNDWDDEKSERQDEKVEEELRDIFDSILPGCVVNLDICGYTHKRWYAELNSNGNIIYEKETFTMHPGWPPIPGLFEYWDTTEFDTAVCSGYLWIENPENDAIAGGVVHADNESYFDISYYGWYTRKYRINYGDTFESFLSCAIYPFVGPWKRDFDRQIADFLHSPYRRYHKGVREAWYNESGFLIRNEDNVDYYDPQSTEKDPIETGARIPVKIIGHGWCCTKEAQMPRPKRREEQTKKKQKRYYLTPPRKKMDDCCKATLAILSEIYEVLNPPEVKENNLPARWFVPGATGLQKFQGYPGLFKALFLANDMQSFIPFQVELKDNNAAQEGNQPLKLQFNTLSAALQKTLELLLDTESDGDVTNNLLVRLAYEVMIVHQIVAVTERYAKNIEDFLGYEVQNKQTTLPMMFNPLAGKDGIDFNEEETTEKLLPELMKETDFPIKVTENVQLKDMQEYLLELLNIIQSSSRGRRL